jgi:acyl-CoA synthetase (NDP forming)
MHQLVRTAPLYLKGWRPRDRRIVVVSNSGASCVMAADSTQALALEIAPLSAATVETLTAPLPSFATATNPIDITAALLTDSRLFGESCRRSPSTTPPICISSRFRLPAPTRVDRTIN